MMKNEESSTVFQHFQECVGKIFLFGRGRTEYRKRFLEVNRRNKGYAEWTEFKWDHCLLLEDYAWDDERCKDATLLSDKSFYSGFEVAAKIYVDNDVHLVKARVEDFIYQPGEDENV
jgi:hypothetical protein